MRLRSTERSACAVMNMQPCFLNNVCFCYLGIFACFTAQGCHLFRKLHGKLSYQKEVAEEVDF